MYPSGPDFDGAIGNRRVDDEIAELHGKLGDTLTEMQRFNQTHKRSWTPAEESRYADYERQIRDLEIAIKRADGKRPSPGNAFLATPGETERLTRQRAEFVANNDPNADPIVRATLIPGSTTGVNGNHRLINRRTGEVIPTFRGGVGMNEWIRERKADHPCVRAGVDIRDVLSAYISRPTSQLEERALQEGIDSAGGFTTPDWLYPQYISYLAAQSTLMPAGATVFPLVSDMNRLSKLDTLPTPAWRAELDALAQSDPTIGAVDFVPHSLGLEIVASVELTEDSPNIGQQILESISKAFGQEFDRAGLFGDGTSNQPVGLSNMAGFTSVASTDFSNYNEIVDVVTTLLRGNTSVPATAITSPGVWGMVQKFADSTGQPLMPPPGLAGLRMLQSSGVPEDLGGGSDSIIFLSGDWSQFYIGDRHGLRVRRLTERRADTNAISFVATQRIDFQVTRMDEFIGLSGITIA